MLRFFRQIRQRLFTDNKFSKYLLYAVGEILLVVIGILIALQVNNWNEERIKKKRYEFGIEQIHKRIHAKLLTQERVKDKAYYHLAVVDSLLTQLDSIPPNRILGNVLILDKLVGSFYVKEDLYLDYLDFSPTDSTQFKIMEIIKLYFGGGSQRILDLYLAKEGEGFIDLLKHENIPLCDIDEGQSYDDFILECSREPFNSMYEIKLMELISSDKFQAKLHTHKKKCMDIITMDPYPESPTLASLEKSFKFLSREFKTMEIVGSGTMAGDWIKGYKMKRANNESAIWQCNIQLQDGYIKFRVDESWQFNWGTGEYNRDILIANGTNIPVEEGEYHVVIDLEKNTYQLNPL